MSSPPRASFIMPRLTAERRLFPVVPLAPIALALALGIMIDRFTSLDITTSQWASFSVAMILAAGVAECFANSRFSTIALMLAFLGIGGGWHHTKWFDLADDDLAHSVDERPQIAWLRGRLIEPPSYRPSQEPHQSGQTRATIDIDEILDEGSWGGATGRAQASLSGDLSQLEAGDRVELIGKLSTWPPAMNPGEFAYGDYLRAQGVRLRLQVDDPASVKALGNSSENGGMPRWIGRARSWSLKTLARGLDARTLPLAAALVLGRRELVDPDVNQSFARTGTSHLLAISGLHLQVLALAVGFSLLLVGVRRVPAWAIVAVVTVAYALLVGLVPSVVRSAAMTVTTCLAVMRYRCRQPADVMALAVIVTIGMSPLSLFDVGGQLSFLAVAVIIWVVPPILGRFERKLSPLDALEWKLASWPLRLARWMGHWLWQGLVLSTIVWLAALPLVVMRFHVVSPIGIFLNIPLVPITSLALLLAGSTLALTAIWPPLAYPTAWASSRLLELTEFIVRWGAARSWGHTFEPGPPQSWVIVFYLWLGLATWTQSRWLWRGLGFWSALGIWLALSPVRPSSLEAQVLAVEHGLAVIHQAADGHAILYDCGKMSDPGVGRRVIASALWSKRIRRLDAIILSHADADHYNGLTDLLERFTVDQIMIPPSFATPANPLAGALLDQVRVRGIPIVVKAQGDHWTWSGVRLTVHHPPRDWSANIPDNARSLVLEVESDGHNALWTGDLDGPGLTAFLGRSPSPPDVVLAPHHGGRTANPEWFYQRLQPKAIVVSQRRPPPGTTDALARVAAKGFPIARTWERGAITLRWSPSGITSVAFFDVPESTLFPVRNLPMTWLIAIVGFLVGTLGFAIMAVIEWSAWSLIAPGRRLTPRPVEPVPWEQVALTRKDGVTLAGALLPHQPPVDRLLIILHGFGEDRTAMWGRAEQMAEEGWDTFVFDSRAQGRSGGETASFGGREVDDLQAWLDRLNAPIGRVVLWGRSMGASVALQTAARDPRIGALVLEAPYASLNAAVGSLLTRSWLPRQFARPILRRASRLAGASVGWPTPLELAPSVTIPILIIHGSNDRLIPMADVKSLANAFPTPAPILEVPNAQHSDVAEMAGAPLYDQLRSFLDPIFNEKSETIPIKD